MNPYTQLPKTATAHVDDDNERWPPEVRAKLLAEFFFDVNLIVNFYTQRTRCVALSVALIPFYSILLAPILCASACTVRKNQQERAGSMRVGLTNDELIFMVGTYGGLCRCRCQQNGGHSTLVPLDRVTDIVIKLPAGGCCPPNVLSTVHVQTAGQGALGSSEIKLEGLVDPDHFRRTILALRHGDPLPEPRDPKAARLYRQPGSGTKSAIASTPVHAPDAPAPAAPPSAVAHDEAVVLLRDVKDEMARVNENLAAMRALMEKNVKLVDI